MWEAWPAGPSSRRWSLASNRYRIPQACSTGGRSDSTGYGTHLYFTEACCSPRLELQMQGRSLHPVKHYPIIMHSIYLECRLSFSLSKPKWGTPAYMGAAKSLLFSLFVVVFITYNLAPIFLLQIKFKIILQLKHLAQIFSGQFVPLQLTLPTFII